LSSSAPPGLHLFDDPREQVAFTRFETGAGGERLAVSQLRVAGITCAACAPLIEDALRACPGVLAARVSAARERAEVRWLPGATRVSALLDAVQRAGYDAVPDLAAPARVLREQEARQSLWRVVVAGFCMMQIMMYATPAYVAAPGDIPADLLRLLQWASWLLCIPVLLFSASGIWAGAWASVRARRISMQVPVALGLAVTFIASSGATFEPGGVFGHEVYFDSLSMFVFLLLGGRELERRARHHAAASLEALTIELPASVQRLLADGQTDGQTETVAVRDLRVGDRVQVAPGQTLPADGELIGAPADVSEALLSGESRPVPKQPGDALLAGSINGRRLLQLRVQRLGADTRHAAIAALVRAAATARPAATALADRWAGAFLWAVLVLAAGAAAVWSQIDPGRALWVAVSVLIVTCPCALSLAGPAVWLAAAGALARGGVLLQRLGAIEALARVDTVMLDKTGTLTEDRMSLHSVHLQPAARAQRLDAEAIQPLAMSLAALSTHPLARSLAEARVGTASETASLGWHQVSEFPGLGIEGVAADGRCYRLGRAAWVGGDAEEDAAAGAETSTCFGPSGQAWARFSFSEALRPDAHAAVRRLRDAGLAIALLSGDAAPRVLAVARELGIADARGGCSPQAKLDALAGAQAAGHVVVMVGDGSNDAPVLARADASFAFAQGSALAQGEADALLLHNRLGDVADAVLLARRAVRVVRQNLAWAALYNAACIPLALSGHLPPWAAGIGMAASSLVVVLNALRLARRPVMQAAAQGSSAAPAARPATA